MSATWKTVRVFISSTFRDMHAERDHLVRFVFPRLRQELLQRRIHLVDVDLRWGVTSEQDALSVCREVVDECRPRFLCMLGGRYGWVPPGKTRSITADEVHYGVLDRDLKSRGFAYFYFRDPSATAAMVEVAPGEFREPVGSHGADALAALKAAVTEARLQPFVYRAQWDDPSRRLLRLKEFGDRVYADLKQSIDQEFGPATGEKPDEFTEENAAMEAFIEERVQRFVLGSRQTVWDELLEHAQSTGGNGYLCLTGASGSGKSALLGKFCQDYREAHPQDLVIPHFVGASPGSTDVRRTLRRLCHELVAGAGLTVEIPEDPEKLRVAFGEILQQASATKRIVILLDAINQFDATTQLAGWSWLPEELPATARIILSTVSVVSGQSSVASGQQTALSPLDALRHRRIPPHKVELEPLTAEDAEAIINEFLHRYRKSMTADQRAALLSKADAGTPLYLLAALEELRTLGTYEEITDRIAQLPPDTRALFIWILKRLEDDPGFLDSKGQQIGQQLVSRFVSLLGVSRHGLSQQELEELLSPGDPQGNVATLTQLLRPYLMLRGDFIDFYHQQMALAVEHRYLPEDTKWRQAHAELVGYFRDRWLTADHHALADLPYHATYARAWNELDSTLGNLTFIKAKSAAAMASALLADYLIALASPALPPALHKRLLGFHNFVRAECHVLSVAPELTLQQALNAPTDSPVALAAKAVRTAGDSPPWFEWLNRPRRQLRALTLAGHTDGTRRLAVSPVGRTFVSAGKHEITLWNTETGEALWTRGSDTDRVAQLGMTAGAVVIRTQAGHVEVRHSEGGGLRHRLHVTPAAATVMAVLPALPAVLTGDVEGVVRLWHADSGELLLAVTAHQAAITAVAGTADGRILATAGADLRVAVYSRETGKHAAALTGHTEPVHWLHLTDDGRHALSVSCREARYWTLQSGAFIETSYAQHLQMHTAVDRDLVALAPDGSFAVLGREQDWADQGRYGAFDVWDLRRNERWEAAGNYGEPVYCVAMAATAPVAVVGIGHILEVWDLSRRQCVQMFHGLNRDVSAVAITRDDQYALVGSGDTEINLWELAREDAEMTLWNSLAEHNPDLLSEHEFRYVHALAITPDGRRAVGGNASCKYARVWDLETPCQTTVLRRDGCAFDSLLITPDSRWLLAAGAFTYNGAPISVWDLQTGDYVRSLDGIAAENQRLVLAPDGRHILARHERGEILKVWDIPSGKCTAEIEIEQTGAGFHRTPGAIEDFHITSDSRHLVLRTEQGSLVVWDLRQQRCLRQDPCYFADIALFPGSQKAIAVSRWGEVRLGSIRSDSSRWRRLAGCRNEPGSRYAVSLTPSKRYAIVTTLPVTGPTELTVYDLRHRHRLFSKPYTSHYCVTPDETLLLTIDTDQRLRFTTFPDGEPLAEEASISTREMHCTPDGRYLLLVAHNCSVEFWEIATRRRLTAFIGSGDLRVVAVSQDALKIAIADTNGQPIFLALRDVQLGPRVVTAWQPQSVWANLRQALGLGNDTIAYQCPCCADRSFHVVYENNLGSDCTCPECGTTLHLNPFVIDAMART